MNRKQRRATKQPNRQRSFDEARDLLSEGMRHQRAGSLQDAAKSFTRAIKHAPDLAEAHYNLGTVLGGLGRRDEAIRSYRRAIALKPSLEQAHFNLGNALKDVSRSDDALESYAQALSHSPEDPDVLNNMGVLLKQMGRLDEAVAAYQRAITVTPNEPNLHANLGLALRDLGHLDEAAAALRRAIAIDPSYAVAHSNLGKVLKELGQLAEAVASYRHVIALTPDNPLVHYDLGLALMESGDLDEAAISFRQAITLDDHFAAAYSSLADTLTELGRHAEVVDCYERMLMSLPSVDAVFSRLVLARRHLCDWREFAADDEKCRALFRSGDPEVAPFTSIAISPSPAEQLLCARSRAGERTKGAGRLPEPLPRARDKLRLGYVSFDFRDHALAILIAELLERHDRERFELVGYSMGPHDGSAVAARLRRIFDHFVDVRALSDAAAAQRIRDDEIDILVDLTGYATGSRPAIFAWRPAPIQVNFLGYPGTMGGEFLDYVIADRVTLPFSMQPFYDERIVHLPDCFQPRDTTRAIAERTPSRAECYLPESGFVFCCFNNPYKITPMFFDIWMRMLSRIEGSVLWILAADQIHQRNLQREATARDIDPARLVFAPRVPLPAHLARHRIADLFLDTLPCNAHTTASDALWAGLPVLTCIGETFAGRVASSLLHAINLPDLVTHSLGEYEALGLRLAGDPTQLAGLRLKLEANRHTSALFDMARFAHNLEAAFEHMWNNWVTGRPPGAFAVKPVSASGWKQFVSPKPRALPQPAADAHTF